MKTYELHDDYDHVVCRDKDESTKDDCWKVISWLADFWHPPATTVISLYKQGLYATALELYDRSKF